MVIEIILKMMWKYKEDCISTYIGISVEDIQILYPKKLTLQEMLEKQKGSIKNQLLI